MKATTQLCFYSVISNEIADFSKYKELAQETVRLLNTYKLGEQYPASFFYLKTTVKGVNKYYAGSVANPSDWNDPAFTRLLDKDHEPLPMPGRHRRTKNNNTNR